MSKLIIIELINRNSQSSRAICLCLVFETFMVSNMIIMMFGAAAPRWTCADDDSTMLSSAINLTVAKENLTFATPNCSVYNTCTHVVYEESLKSLVTEVRAKEAGVNANVLLALLLNTWSQEFP